MTDMPIYEALLNPQSGQVASLTIRTRDGCTYLSFPGAPAEVVVPDGTACKFEATPINPDAGPFKARLVRL